MGRLLWVIALLIATTSACAQQWVSGRITDARTGETVPLVHVYYDDAKRGGVVADERGNYRIRYRVGRTLVFDVMGYDPVSVITNRAGTRNVKMREATYGMSEVVVERKRTKYSRKNNPAVEMMKKVIASKRFGDLDAQPFYSYKVYEKQTCAINEFLAKSRPELVDSLAKVRELEAARARGEQVVLPGDTMKRKPKAFAFLEKYAERCEETGKTVLPVLVEETVRERLHRSEPLADKSYVLAHQSKGVNEIFSIGGELNTILADVFQDINIYKDDVRLFQRHFMSPIADGAIGFYRYYIEDTVYVTPLNYDARAKILPAVKAYRLTFTPNNPQDFGFSGELLVTDSTWQVHSCEINIPSRSGVNFVDELCVKQAFGTLDDGRRVLLENDMTVQMSLLDFLTKLQVQRVTRRSDFSFEPIADERFKGLAKEITDPDAEIQGADYWARTRPMALTPGETRIDSMIHDIESVKGYKLVHFVVKALGENFVETRKGGGAVDIGPVRKSIGYNSIEGFRLTLGAQTTARFSPHWYLQGYVGYGFGDKRWKVIADVTYSFNRKKYRPHEFPVHALSVRYIDEIMSMADRKRGENRNDLFSILQWGRANKYKMYQRAVRVNYTREWANGLQINLTAVKEWVKPAGDLRFQLNGDISSPYIERLENMEFTAKLRYQPGNTYVNTKRKRIETNKDAPIYQISHTISPRGLWGNKYMSNVTEFETYHRLWLSSWGRMDFTVRGAWQWNTVPFLFLNAPDANKTYVMMRRRFCLMDEMEFLNDRNLSVHWKWDLAGKIFNRIPLLRKLKWRETIGFNLLWGELSSKNDPEKNVGDGRLWRMPGSWDEAGEWHPYCTRLDPKKPYLEVYAGIFNIFKFFNITYVHRVTYRDTPDVNTWGIRVGLELAF